MKFKVIVFLNLVILLISSSSYADDAKSLARLEPADGKCYAGANLNLGEFSPEKFNSQTGFKHAIFVDFFHFPIKDGKTRLENFIKKCKEANAIALITLEPFEGLKTVTKEESAKFAEICAKEDWAFIVRFAHEMNGSWYPWGQQPKIYIEKFRLLADTIHEKCPKGAMLWAPNCGHG